VEIATYNVESAAEHSEFGAIYKVTCPTCGETVRVAEFADWGNVCGCGYKWTVTVIAVGVKNDKAEEWGMEEIENRQSEIYHCNNCMLPVTFGSLVWMNNCPRCGAVWKETYGMRVERMAEFLTQTGTLLNMLEKIGKQALEDEI
jgi:ribosomal protein S27AE